MLKGIQKFQDAFGKIVNCRLPVIAGAHNKCIGAGVDIISCCDIRYCTEDASFSIKEIDLAIVADVGTL